MSIEHINGNGLISGYGNHSGESYSQEDSTLAEDIVLDHLVRNYNLRRTQAVAVLAAVLARGCDVTQMANGLQSGNAAVIAQFEQFIP